MFFQITRNESIHLLIEILSSMKKGLYVFSQLSNPDENIRSIDSYKSIKKTVTLWTLGIFHAPISTNDNIRIPYCRFTKPFTEQRLPPGIRHCLRTVLTTHDGKCRTSFCNC